MNRSVRLALVLVAGILAAIDCARKGASVLTAAAVICIVIALAWSWWPEA